MPQSISPFFQIGKHYFYYYTYVLGRQDGDGNLLPLRGLDEALEVSAGALVGDPAGLLGIVGLGLELLPQLEGNH